MEQMDKEQFKAEQNAFSNIDHVIGIVSGKGGVGKSFVTASLANAMAAQGFRVGILDADITGPSIPKMYGLHGKAEVDGNGIYPPLTENGIEIMSTNLILDGEEDPVVWRGPVIAGVVKQFWTDVIWGQLDFLLIDMPPGTGDVPLTVYQSLPIEGIFIVTSPQDLVRMIVTKAYNMAGKMDIPVLGMIENYSYVECPDCGKRIQVFGESHIDEIAEDLSVPVTGKMPIRQEYASAADAGEFASVLNEYIDDSIVVLRKIADGNA